MRLLLVGCFALTVTACGGGGGEFTRKANAVCARQAGGVRAARGNPDALDRLAQAEINDLRALDPPHAARDRFAALTAELARQLDDVHYLRVGVASGDSQMAQAALNLARRAHTRARRHALALGLDACGR